MERTAPMHVLGMAFDPTADDLAGWELPDELGLPSAEEIEQELALGHPAWGSLLRAEE